MERASIACRPRRLVVRRRGIVEPDMRIILSDFISLDGVVQAPGGKDEDTNGGFQHGGWSMPFCHPRVDGNGHRRGHGAHAVESFWARMQTELLDTRKWMTRLELSTAIGLPYDPWARLKGVDPNLRKPDPSGSDQDCEKGSTRFRLGSRRLPTSRATRTPGCLSPASAFPGASPGSATSR